jgi:hypothetical protein
MSTVFQQDHILGRGWILRSSLTLYMCEPFFTKIPKRSAHDILNDIFKRLGPKESPWKSNHSNLFSPLSSKERIHIAWSKRKRWKFLKNVPIVPKLCLQPLMGRSYRWDDGELCTANNIPFPAFSKKIRKSPKLICMAHRVSKTI